MQPTCLLRPGISHAEYVTARSRGYRIAKEHRKNAVDSLSQNLQRLTVSGSYIAAPTRQIAFLVPFSLRKGGVFEHLRAEAASLFEATASRRYDVTSTLVLRRF